MDSAAAQWLDVPPRVIQHESSGPDKDIAIKTTTSWSAAAFKRANSDMNLNDDSISIDKDRTPALASIRRCRCRAYRIFIGRRLGCDG
jgi:hypothetical protein